MDVFQTRSGDNEIKMVYFELDLASSGQYSLRAHGANENGERETSDFDLAIVPTGPTMQFDPSENYYSQQITRGNVKAYAGIATGSDTPIPEASLPVEVYLTPCTMKDENGETLIYFRITEPYDIAIECPDAPGVNARGSISTNPSPPARPCEANCEEPIFRKKYNKNDLRAAPVTK